MPNISEKLQENIDDFISEMNDLINKITVFSDDKIPETFIEGDESILFSQYKLFVIDKIIRIIKLTENVSQYGFITQKDVEEIKKIEQEFLLKLQEQHQVKSADLYIFISSLKELIQEQFPEIFQKLSAQIQVINQSYQELKVENYFNSLMKIKDAVVGIKKAIEIFETQSVQDPRLHSLELQPLKDLEVELSRQYQQRLIAFFNSSKVHFTEKYYEKLTEEDRAVLERPLTEKYQTKYEDLSEEEMLEFINRKVLKIQQLKKEYEEFITTRSEISQSKSEINPEYYLAFCNLSAALNGLSDNEEAQKQLLFLMNAMKDLARENQKLREENSRLQQDQQEAILKTQEINLILQEVLFDSRNPSLNTSLESSAQHLQQASPQKSGFPAANQSLKSPQTSPQKSGFPALRVIDEDGQEIFWV